MLQIQKILKTLWHIRTLFSLSVEVGIHLKGWNFPIWLLKVKSLNLQVWVNGVTMCHNDYQNHPFCIAKNSNYKFPCWRGSLQLLLLRRIWLMPFSCLQFKVMDPHFISSDDLWWKAFTVSQWHTQEFFSGGVQQIQLRTEDRENRDLEAVSP